jgi:hypothetical protein
MNLAEAKEIKKALIDKELTMKWLWRRVIKKGFGTLHYSRFTEIMNGSYVGGYAPAVIEAAQEVLKDYEP